MTKNILQRLQDSQGRTHSSSAKLIHALMQSVDEGIAFISHEGKILSINPVARSLLSTIPIKTGEKYWDLFSDEYFGFSMREALFLGVLHEKVYRTIQSREIEISSVFIPGDSREPSGLLLLLRDITEISELKSKLQHSCELQKLGEMVATISHEIRNPLGAVRGYASLLSRDLCDAKHLQEMAEYIIDGTRNLERLVTRILEYAKPVKLDLKTTEVGGFIRKFVQFIKEDPSKPGLVHQIVHIPQESFIAPLDCLALQSALLNIVFNAYQAMPTGGTLTFSVLKMDCCYQIAISDTGIGMTEDELQHIFSPFFTTKEKGNGIGLSEVQKVIKAHFGTIDVRSNPLKGTTFTLTLPLQRA